MISFLWKPKGMPELGNSMETNLHGCDIFIMVNCLEALNSSAEYFLHRHSDRAVMLYQGLKPFTQPLRIREGAGTDIHSAVLMEY